MNQAWKNDKKPNFRLDCGLFVPNVDPQFFFRILSLLLDIVTSYYSVQLKGKLVIQSFAGFISTSC